jgi:hypothetical protein
MGLYLMDTKTKKLVFLIGAILIAVIFITSYAAFSSNNTASTTTTTVKSVESFFATGSSNAIITNYSDIAYVVISNSTNFTKENTTITTELNSLESNGSIDNYINTNNSYQVVLSSVSAYDVQQLLYKDLGTQNTIKVGSTAYITLPPTITLFYNNQPITTRIPSQNYSIYMQNIKAINSTINVSISTLVTANGSIYNNQFRVSYSG